MSSVVNEFLARCIQRVSSRVSPLTIVLGNEGGDMDSIIGAIFLAMFFERSSVYQFANPVPLLNFPVEDFPLRNDVAKLFQNVGIDASLLMSSQMGEVRERFVDVATLNAEVVLYDHNRLRENQTSLSEKVVGIVDHHFDEKYYTDATSKLRVLKTVGSACTLVAELYRDEMLKVPCSELLMAPIVLDTVNFDPAQQKVTPDDVSVYKWLETSQCKKSSLSEKFFAQLSNWKNDVLSLTVSENLRRDYKCFPFPTTEGTTLLTGTSSVPCSCQEFEKRYNVNSIVEATAVFIKSHKLDVLIFAFAGKIDGKHTREVAFCGTKNAVKIFAPFIDGCPDGVSFSKLSSGISSEGTFVYDSYSLSDFTVSRKKLVPALRQFLSKGTLSLL